MSPKCHFKPDSDALFVSEPNMSVVVVKETEIYDPGCQLVRMMSRHFRV